jgi:hypothetical protein
MVANTTNTQECRENCSRGDTGVVG